MGNTRSASETNREEDIWWINGEQQQSSNIPTEYPEEPNTISQKTHLHETVVDSEREQRKREMQEDFIKFKQELARKHEKRRQLIVEKKKEMIDLREELVKEKEENERLRRLLQENRLSSQTADICGKSLETDKLSEVTIASIKEENEELKNEIEKLILILREKDMLTDKNKELRISLAEMQKELQNVNTQIISFEKERIDYQEHVTALKDIIRVTKEMLRVRESQIEELKKKISSIEELLASKEISILSDDLRQEYERQLRNIRDLRILYEDRQRVDRREKQNLQTQIEELKKNVEDEQKKNGEFTERITELEEDNSKKYDKIVVLDSNLGLAKAECNELHAEMEVINQLFSQILISFNNDQDIDLDNMIKILEQNHDLLTNIVINDESNQTSALPKVLLDLVKQVNENKKDNRDIPSTEGSVPPQIEKVEKLDTIEEEEENQLTGTHQLNSPEEIVENLPKVWRVLIELLSHQSPPNNEITEKKGENDNHCYKSVETPTGSRKVLSVSKTFIRLKSLILEKKSLEKEMTRLKQLNTHLEGRLSDQEKRLVLVSNELSKTWNFVGKMQKQHQQLHTQEKILRYELAQKRKLLTELKEELEYCRQKWSQARKQNSSTEEQWKQLRTEFASRKTSITDDINNSVESGYSDDKSSSDDEEDADYNKSQKIAASGSSQPNDEPISKEDVRQDSRLKGEDEINVVQNEEASEIISEREPNNTINIGEKETQDQSATMDTALKENVELVNLSVESGIIDNKHLSLDAQKVQEVLSLDSNSGICQSSQGEETDQVGKLTQDIIDPTSLENASQLLKNEETISANESKIVPDLQNVPTPVAQDALAENMILLTSSTTLDKLEDCSEKTNDELSSQCSASNLELNASTNIDNPSTSCKNPVEAAAEFAARREERMKNLEEQCKDLYFSVAKNSLRGLVMSNKLDNLHEMYGEQSQDAAEQQSTLTEEATECEEECQSNPAADCTDKKDNQE